MNPGLSVAVAAAGAAVLAGLGVFLWRRRAIPAAEKERRRRIQIGREGRLTDGEITDAHGNVLFYTYSVRGVQYTASQEVSHLPDRLPADPSAMLGPVAVKFLPGNPANSILLSEEWSGFRGSNHAGGRDSSRAGL